jgi:S-disulfanyl-L-cysteine oxidoreductase SoxD
VQANKNILVWLGVALCGLSYQPLYGQAAPTTGDGVYSAAQAQRGEDLFKKQCASCHGEALDGAGPYPPLSGDEFLNKYTGVSAQNVYDMIQKLMPATAPGTLTRPQAADLLAYILSFNKYPAGKTDLPSDQSAIQKLIIPKPAPKT